MTNRLRQNTRRGISAVLVALLLSSFPAATPIASRLPLVPDNTASIVSAEASTAESLTTDADDKSKSDQQNSPTPTSPPSTESSPPPTPSPSPVPTPVAAPAPASNSIPDPASKQDTASAAQTQTDPGRLTTKPAGATDPPKPDAAIKNTVSSTATSGDAAVTNNDDAGDAASGDATAEATVINVVNSSSSNLGQGSSHTLVCDLHNPAGATELQRTIVIDPSSLAELPDCRQSGTDTGQTTANSQAGNPAQSSSNVVDIENNVTLKAVSGNATVAGNDDAGDATTGDATALANIINIVSSSVGAGSTFLGVINIHGNLRGDILVPQSFVDSLFADNGGNTTASLSSETGDSPTRSKVTSHIGIANNVDLNAKSGNATVAGNDTAGDAASGDALTNLTVFNLTGQEVIAKNSLLVFVNVMGHWVGLITNAPGSTSAAFAGGGNTSQQTPAGNHDSTVNIRNNISVSATSGDATVANNDNAGSARSGKAVAGVNILNLVHSSFSLNDWFGVLFINVLGNWLGNFGIRATETDTPPSGQPSNGGQPINLPEGTIRAVKVFSFNTDTNFRPAADSSTIIAAARQNDDSQEIAQEAINPAGQVLGADDTPSHPQLPQTLTSLDNLPLLALLASLALLLGLSAIAIRRRLAART